MLNSDANLGYRFYYRSAQPVILLTDADRYAAYFSSTVFVTSWIVQFEALSDILTRASIGPS